MNEQHRAELISAIMQPDTLNRVLRRLQKWVTDFSLADLEQIRTLCAAGDFEAAKQIIKPEVVRQMGELLNSDLMFTFVPRAYKVLWD